MKIPESEHSIAALIYKAYEKNAEPPRPHIGASQLGHPCDRKIWLSFRWAVQQSFSGRMLLLFQRGHEEEQKIAANLRRIGIHVEKTGAHQACVDFGSHVSGSADGLVSGLPNGYKGKALLECKTHSDKSFAELVKHGVKKAKPEHWIQCCIYGFGLGLDRALYYAVNKNTDEIYTEWLHLDKETAEKYVRRGHYLALAERMPPPLSTDPSWYQCKFCDAHSFCHGETLTKHANCRTCAHSTPKEDSTWRCERHQADGIPVKFQQEGCDSHTLHPDLVPWPMLDSPDEWVAVYEVDGKPVKNGAGHYASTELIANASACASGIKDEWSNFGAKIVG